MESYGHYVIIIVEMYTFPLSFQYILYPKTSFSFKQDVFHPINERQE